MISYLYEKLNVDPANPAFLTGNNAAFPRDLYHRVGGLDVTWPMCGEGRDFCARWRSHGFAMTYVPNAVVHHAHDLDFRRFWRQHFNYGRGARRLRRTCAERGDEPSTRFERLSFYAGLPLAAFGHAAGSRPLLVASLLVLSQISNVAGYVREWMRPSDKAPTWQVETSR